MYRKIKKPFHPSGETGSRKLVGFSKLSPHSEEVSQMNLDSKEIYSKGAVQGRSSLVMQNGLEN